MAEFLAGIGLSPVVFWAIIAVILLIIIFARCYKVADVDKVLIITGGKKPRIIISGGAFVMPIFRKADYFDLCMLTVSADKDEIKTSTAVPIVADWTAQIRPDTADKDKLAKAIISFKERGQKGIIDDIKLTLTGAVRNVVASMTPEQVLKDKEGFATHVKEDVKDEMDRMGMELVSLNIQDITDHNGYYDNMAAPDAAEKKRIAEVERAIANQDVRIKKAETEQEAKKSELDTELAIAAKSRDNDIKRAEYKTETDVANANAEVAGQLQKTKRAQEIEAEKGRVEIVRQEQANLAAIKEKDVIVTRANSEREKHIISAETEANTRKIAADASVEVAQREAEAVKVQANAIAEKTRQEGAAEAEVTRQKGIAEANIIREKGLAEAESEKARLLAQAEGERALADARASNEKVNFEIEKIKIEANARVEIATKTAQIMADIGRNAEFVNIGGTGASSKTGNVLTDTLSSIPELMKKLDVENQALNGKTMSDEIKELVASIASPIKGEVEPPKEEASE